MKRRGRTKKSKCWTISKISQLPEKDNQTAISKFLIKQQENNHINHFVGGSDVSVPLYDDSALSCYSSLSLPTCKSLKVPSEYKENCIKSRQEYNLQYVDSSPTKNDADQNKGMAKEKKCRKQIMFTQNHLLTDYFPVRRSNRKTLSSAKKERQSIVEDAVLSGKEEGFEIKYFPGKGRGVVTKKPIKRGEFVLEYYGELIEYEEAKKRESMYATRENTGCYMYYFKFRNKRYCVDATKETNRLGRLVNHSKKGNLKTQPFFIKECPHLVFLACRDIEPGEELSYDYGDRRKAAVESHPWLAF